MHFLMFIFLFTMIAISVIALVCYITTFYKDITDMQWQWVPMHLASMAIIIFVLHHFVYLMIKFANA